jgi:hypothetical protein
MAEGRDENFKIQGSLWMEWDGMRSSQAGMRSSEVGMRSSQVEMISRQVGMRTSQVREPKGRGTLASAGDGLGESQLRRLEKSVALCLLCDPYYPRSMAN